jgi:hypothetical protein
MNNYQFYYNNIKLENAKSYKYLGPLSARLGTFGLARQELRKIGLKG